MRRLLTLVSIALMTLAACSGDDGGDPGQGACTPACTGLACGDDGCGGSCGDCAAGLFCNAGACEDTCVSDTACAEDGQVVCNDDASGARTCEAVADGCFQLGDTALCDPGQSCEGGACQAAVTADCVVIKPLATRVAQPTVGSVAVAFSVATCEGEPLVGLGPSSFAIYEDGEPISATESGADILPREAVTYVTLVLDNSPSVKAAGGLQDAVAAAKGFAASLMTDDPLSVRVAVAVFSLAFELRQEHTSDQGQVLAAIDGLLTDETGINTTNLYGALIDAIDHNDSVQDQLFTDMRGGVLTQGQVIMFTDGSDQAAVATLAQAQAAADATNDEVRMVAFGTEVDSEVLESLATGGAYIGASSAELGALFATVAEQI
ncbi:MAG: VWA domain-containing protein, partial [Myxococcota bacterium]|nr:VWA domain-containing protein [Myxococcota bacterium]